MHETMTEESAKGSELQTIYRSSIQLRFTDHSMPFYTLMLYRAMPC